MMMHASSIDLIDENVHLGAIEASFDLFTLTMTDIVKIKTKY
jgi:hypothetical protein